MTFSGNFGSRISIEQAAVAREISQFKFFKMGNDNYFMGWHTTSISKRTSELKLDLPKFYPDQMPELFVTSPRTLWKYGGGTINSIGLSHAFHTQENGPNGCVQICHFKYNNWDASKNCVGVFFKGMLWLEAYDVHLITGKDIATILDIWKRSLNYGKGTRKGSTDY